MSVVVSGRARIGRPTVGENKSRLKVFAGFISLVFVAQLGFSMEGKSPSTVVWILAGSLVMGLLVYGLSVLAYKAPGWLQGTAEKAPGELDNNLHGEGTLLLGKSQVPIQGGLGDINDPGNFSNCHGAFVIKVLSALQPGSRQGFRSPTISTSRTTPQSLFRPFRNQAPLKLGDQAKQVHEEPRHRAFARINPLLCDDKCDATPVKVCQHVQEILQRAGNAVKASDKKLVASPK